MIGVDYSELGTFTCGDVALGAREHQVVAMFAYGFVSDDRIVAEHLGIKSKYVNSIVCRLRKKYGWRTRRAMGEAYLKMIG